MSITIGVWDVAVIIAYLVGIVGLGCWAGWRQRRLPAGESKDYFLAGGTLTWVMIGAALFSTNISTIHLVSLAQEGYVNGLAYGNFEWMAAFTLIALSLFFAPSYIRSRVATLPDFLEKRYNRPCRDWLAVLSSFPRSSSTSASRSTPARWCCADCSGSTSTQALSRPRC